MHEDTSAKDDLNSLAPGEDEEIDAGQQQQERDDTDSNIAFSEFSIATTSTVPEPHTDERKAES